MFVHKNLDGILDTDQEPEDRNLITVVLSLCFIVILLVSSRTEQVFVVGDGSSLVCTCRKLRQ